jgi:hypothetical protein
MNVLARMHRATDHPNREIAPRRERAQLGIQP